jgi:hypothetical protein
MEWGNIVKATIQNTQVSRVDTLVSIKTAMCQYPAISTDGKNVAFYRWKYYADGNTLRQSGSNYVAVINANGGTIRNLVALSGDPGYDATLDWPSDGWIYYVKPRAAGGSYWDREGYEIWKVNPYAADPASTSQLAYSIPAGGYIRRFSLSQQANRMAMQVYCMPNQQCQTINQLQCFPPPSYAGCVLFGAGGCNMKISASGKFEGHFGGGTHDNTEINGDDGTGKFSMVGGCSWTNSRCSIWNGFKWSGFDMSAPGPGVEQICWSSNSDKWVCENVMWKYSCQSCGTNQMLINWKDGQAIFPLRLPYTANPTNENPSLNAFAGDMWIQPPASHDYAYEDSLGAWHDLTKPAGYGNITSSVNCIRIASAAAISHIDAAGKLFINLPDANQVYRIAVMDMAGRLISSISARNNVTVEIAGQAHGARIVRISDDNGFEAVMKIAPAR